MPESKKIKMKETNSPTFCLKGLFTQAFKNALNSDVESDPSLQQLIKNAIDKYEGKMPDGSKKSKHIIRLNRRPHSKSKNKIS